ncbi:MAG: 16S rRNA (cytidine(1402)-2'-O)-methyltransferase [Bacilli bacterium]|nr:16S rRNA (cytidine(1402)-2'-O)-methyltransferase [Bacilli bacterium]
MSQKSYDGKPTLYLVPTPIGNLADMTYRGVDTLKNSEVIFSEDTRESKKLLDYYGIKKKLIPCHKFNEDDVYLKVLDYLNQGFDVSIITDRGTPSISDPGYVSVYKVISSGFNVVCLPGATAFTPAIVNSGLNPNKFLFYGFLNSKKSAKKKELEDLKLLEYTIIFYESPFRVIETLELIKDIMGNRQVSISREISKKHEEVYRGSIDDILDELIEPKGEFVIVLDGNKEKESYDDLDIIDHINKLIKTGMRDKDAIKEVAKLHNLPKSEVYKEYIDKKGGLS